MISFSDITPTISQVYQYTYSNPKTKTRFEYMKRDVLKTRVRIEKRTVYKKNHESKFNDPEERLLIKSFSYPQYYPYTKVKSKRALKQRKIRHEYDCTILIQNTPNGYSFWDSKIRWHLGSFRKWQDNVPQNKVKSIFNKTRERLERKYAKLPPKERKLAIKKECDKIRQRAEYLDKGDYNSRVNGLNGDYVFRLAPLQLKFDCGYGKVYYTECPKDISFPFFTKHDLRIIEYLLRSGIVKYK